MNVYGFKNSTEPPGTGEGYEENKYLSMCSFTTCTFARADFLCAGLSIYSREQI